MYLYQATRDPFLLEVAVEMLEAIEHNTKTLCGYATVSWVICLQQCIAHYSIVGNHNRVMFKEYQYHMRLIPLLLSTL